VPAPGTDDTTAPALTGAAIRPKRFRARKGATLAFTLDAAGNRSAPVTLRFRVLKPAR